MLLILLKTAVHRQLLCCTLTQFAEIQGKLLVFKCNTAKKKNNSFILLNSFKVFECEVCVLLNVEDLK